MNDLEHKINQYLDGDLSPGELVEFRELLDSSQEARRLLGSMELIRSAARSFPNLSHPDPALESLLFKELFSEEDWAPVKVEEEEDRRRAFVFPLFRAGIDGIAAIGLGRAALALPAILLLFLLGDRFINSDGVADTTEAIASFTPQVDAPVSGANPQVAEGMSGSPAEEDLSTRRSESGHHSLAVSEIGSVEVGNGTLDASAAEPASQADRDSEVMENDVRQPDAPDDIPPSVPFADNSSSRNDANDMPSSQAPPPSDEWNFDRPENENRNGTPFLTASYRHGVASFFGEQDNLLASGQDLNLQFDGQVADRHRLSVVLGSSPLLVAERTYTIHTSTSPGDPKGPETPTPASVTSEESNRVDDEVWAGVGYGYTIFEGNGFRVEAGINAGLGEQSARYGLELPARVNVTDRLGLVVVPYVTRIVPRDQEIRDMEFTGDRYDQFGEEWTPNSTSIGAQIGLSFSFGE